jgi:hypothetical protein
VCLLQDCSAYATSCDVASTSELAQCG